MKIETGCDQLHARIDQGVGWVTFDNQRRLNALSPAMLEALTRVVVLLDEAEVRVLVLAGAGGRAFASGFDLSVLGDASIEAIIECENVFKATCRTLRAFERPVVAMIDGHCLGAGVSLALEADIRVCSELSTFGIPAARIGVGYEDVGPLTRAVGPGWAAEILYVGRQLTSSEAFGSGLVNRCVPQSELQAAVNELAASIASNAPLTIAAAKIALREEAKDASERDNGALQALLDACRRSDDFAEGIRAFAERRAPNFQGR